MDSRVFIGIGSNIGNCIENCQKGIAEISKNPRVSNVVTSSFYITSPVSHIKQNDFINCAISINWKGTPFDLLDFLQTTEKNMGRIRNIKHGPRIIDFDILLFSNLVMKTPNLIVPHPELHKRRFAIIPCIEIDSDIVHPLLKIPLNVLLQDTDKEQMCTKVGT